MADGGDRDPTTTTSTSIKSKQDEDEDRFLQSSSNSSSSSFRSLDSISTKFKGILMDLTSSMGGEDDEGCPAPPASLFTSDGNNSSGIFTDKPITIGQAYFETNTSGGGGGNQPQVVDLTEPMRVKVEEVDLDELDDDEDQDQDIQQKQQSFNKNVELMERKNNIQTAAGDIMNDDPDADPTTTADTTTTADCHQAEGTGAQIPCSGEGNYTCFSGDTEGDQTLLSATENVDGDGSDGVEEKADCDDGIEKEIKQDTPGSKIKLHVSKLPTGFSAEHISNLFEPFGNVVECELFPYKNFAYVHLDNEAGGLEAIKELNKIKLNGTSITVMKSRVKSTFKPSSSNLLEDTVGTFKIYISFMFDGVTKEWITKLVEEYGRVVEVEIYRNNSAFVHMEQEDAGEKVIAALNGKEFPECNRPLQVSQSKNDQGPSVSVVKLQVRNLPEDLSADQIRSLFQPYGLVIKCTLTKSKFDLLRKAVVHLEQLGDIRSAIKDLSELELDGKKLIVEPFVEKTPKPENARQGKNHVPPLMPFKKSSKKRYPPLLPKNQERGRPQFPGFDDMNDGYDFEDYSSFSGSSVSSFKSGRGMFPRGRGGGIGSRGRGGISQYPMEPPYRIPRDRMTIAGPGPFNNNSRGSSGRGFGRGGAFSGQGFQPAQELIPRFPKRPYQRLAEFPQDYGFDEYYEDPVAASARDHYANIQSEYDQYQQHIQSNIQPKFGFPSPPQKRPRGRGTWPRTNSGLSRPQQQTLPSLMPVGFNPFAEDDPEYEDLGPVPYQSHAQSYPSLQLSLGEREYFPPSNNNTNGNRGGGRGGGGGGRGKKFPKPQQQQQLQTQKQVQQTQQKLLQQLESFQQKQQMRASGYSDYLVPEQIPNSSLEGNNFETTAYPSNYYDGVADFNAVPFDYTNMKKRNANQKQQTNFPPGVNPSDYPNLKAGSKVYVNQAGKVMVRGNRGGKQTKKKKHPGLGSTNANPNPNQMPIGGGGGSWAGNNPGPSTSTNTFPKKTFGGNQHMKYKTKQQAKEENQEYSDWLANKSWLHQAIPGVVRPAKK